MIVNQSLPTSYSGLCLCFLYGERRCSHRARPGQGAGAIRSFLAPAVVASFLSSRRQVCPPRLPGIHLQAQLLSLSSLSFFCPLGHTGDVGRAWQSPARPSQPLCQSLYVTIPSLPVPRWARGDILRGLSPIHTPSPRQHRAAALVTPHLSGHPHLHNSALYLPPPPLTLTGLREMALGSQSPNILLMT